MAANYFLNVPRLKGRENYSDWAFAVENFLVLEGLSKCLTEVVTESDAKAKAKLILTIDPSLYVHIKDATTTVSLWTKLKSLFDDSGYTRKISLLRSLISTRLESSASMTDYVNHIVETGQKLRSTGFNVDDEWIGSILLAGLPDHFAPMIMAIEHAGLNISTDSIKQKLLDMEGDVGNRSGAFAVKGWQRQKKHGGNTGGRDKNKRDSGNTGSENVNVRNDVKCYNCKQMGHFKNKCPNIVNKPTENHQKSTGAFNVVFLSGSFSSDDWYIDSGASFHLTAKDDWIENSRPSFLQEIMVANRAKMKVKCCGDVSIKSIVGNTVLNITVKNVLCAPELTTNLLSVSQMIKSGNTVCFEEKSCKVYDGNNTLVAEAELINGVYRLKLEKSHINTFVATAVSSELWHCRFGHINYHDLKLMTNLVEGLNYKGKLESSNFCQTCCEGKQAKLPFKNIGSRATELLETVHADLCGPMEVASIGGSRYFLLLEDDFSKMCFIYFLRNKNETINHFIEFKNFAENQTGQKIKKFRSDNGGEFCCEAFENLFKKFGIVHQKTNPYTPQQNGLSERMNRTLVEKGRCLLFEANLDKTFWAEALNTAVYLRNRSAVKGLDKTPYEAWWNKKPDVSGIRVFGSEVMMQVPKEKRAKWDKKSKKTILVGFSENIKGYRLYDPATKSIVTSRNVIINEKLTPNLNIVLDQNETEDSVSVGEVGNKNEDLLELHQSETSYEDDSSDDEFVASFEEPEQVRKSQRQPKPKSFEDYVTYISAADIDLSDVPMTLTEALSRPDSENWKEAMKEEMDSFAENETWELVDPPCEGTIVQCKWVYKVKSDVVNKCKYRARLVAKGFTQKEGIDYGETFAPVVKYSTLRLLLALAVKLNLKITHLDVKTAFLNGLLKENVYMKQPEGFVVKGFENKVCKLKKAIYGLKQSSRSWYERVDVFLSKLGYERSKLEPCLYSKNENNSLTLVTLYVDDFLILSDSNNETKHLKEHLNSEFKIKDLGNVKYFLGVRIKCNYETGIITLDQENYIEQILKRFGMSDCKGANTPIDTNINFFNTEGSTVCDVNLPYQKLLGCLMYLAVLTRPDIAYAISFLSQFNNCYTEEHWKCAKRVLRYLQNTKAHSLIFSRDSDNSHVEGYVDADWASDKNDRKSYTGYVFKLSGSAVSWKSVKQKSVALSSTEAEYMALSEATKEAIYLRSLLSELIGKLECIVIFNDNQSAQKLSTNPVFHERSKHIDVRYHFIREAISENLIDIKYMQTDEMIADVLTKGLQNVKHNKFVRNMGLRDF